MKYLFIILILVGCKTAYTPSAVRAGSDLGITYLLEEGKVTATEAIVIHNSVKLLLTNKDLTIVLYNSKVRALLSKYQGAGQLASALLITAQTEADARITPEYSYVVNQGLNQMELAIMEWLNWKKIKKGN